MDDEVTEKGSESPLRAKSSEFYMEFKCQKTLELNARSDRALSARIMRKHERGRRGA